LRIRVTLGAAEGGARQGILAAHVSDMRLISTSTARQGAALDLTYRVRLRQPESAVALVTELNRCEDVQEVEFREE
jgi:hypothetical protein